MWCLLNRIRCFFLALMVICLLCACTAPAAQPDGTQVTEARLPEPTGESTEPTQETTEPETEAPTEPPVADTAREMIRLGEYQEAYDLLQTAEETEEIRYLKLRAEIGEVTEGGMVILGSYEQDNDHENGGEPIAWVVLKTDGDKAMLLSLSCLDTQPYHDVIDGRTTWAESTLRQWLNEDFLTAAFNQTEQQFLLETELANPDNPVYNTQGGENTLDRVFLLSLEEVYHDLPQNLRYAQVTEFAKSKGCYLNASGNGWWWLRSPGVYSRDAAYIDSVADISEYGYIVHRPGWAVRPAIWIDLGV